MCQSIGYVLTPMRSQKTEITVYGVQSHRFKVILHSINLRVDRNNYNIFLTLSSSRPQRGAQFQVPRSQAIVEDRHNYLPRRSTGSLASVATGSCLSMGSGANAYSRMDLYYRC